MSVFQDLLDLPKIAFAYALHPLTAAEVFLPHSKVVTWLSGSAAFEPTKDIPHLGGKVILVTGANAGLGKETVYQLARHRPQKIFLAARSQTNAEETIVELNHTLINEGIADTTELVWLHLDLSDLNSVVSAAKHVLERERRLDMLILNAGVMATPPSKTIHGHDLQLGTNHIGHFLLVRLLLPLLEDTAQSIERLDVRIISVSSEASQLAPKGFSSLIEEHEKLCASSNFTRYGVSKAANIAFAGEIERRYGSRGILSVSVHPGIILTDLYAHTRDANIFVRSFLPAVASVVFDDVQHGALNTLWAATAPRALVPNGQYFTPVGKMRESSWVEDVENSKRLWSWTEKQVIQFLPRESTSNR